jgi:hypothetical protein
VAQGVGPEFKPQHCKKKKKKNQKAAMTSSGGWWLCPWFQDGIHLQNRPLSKGEHLPID